MTSFNDLTPSITRGNDAEYNDPNIPSIANLSFRFVTTTDPDQFKDRSTMRENRSHVMYNHISRRPRIEKLRKTRSASSKGKQSKDGISKRSPRNDYISDDSPGPLMRTDEALALFRKAKISKRQQGLRRGIIDEEHRRASESVLDFSDSPSPSSSVSQDVFSHILDDVRPDSPMEQPYNLNCHEAPVGVQQEDQLQRYLNVAYNPFKELLGRFKPNVSFERTLYHCSAYFNPRSHQGRQYMSDPDLVGSPAAFISTFALSSTHLDLIRGQPESVDAISLKADLMGALRNELRNEKTPQSLVAVVHLLLTELPTSDKDTLVVHARGLRKMVEARGGLHALTKDGNIASVLTMDSFLTCAYFEEQAHSIYYDYYDSLGISSDPFITQIPESPLRWPNSDFFSIPHLFHCSEQTGNLIQNMLVLTDLFLDLHSNAHTHAHVSPFPGTPSHEDPPTFPNQTYLTTPPDSRQHTRTLEIARIYHRTLSHPSDPSDPLYETIRLTSLLYATAIHTRTPLSLTFPQSFPDLLVRLTSAYESTPPEAWDALQGPRFWIALTAGAAARGRGVDAGQRAAWIARGVRGLVVLGCEGMGRTGVLRTLRRFLGVQAGLGVGR